MPTTKRLIIVTEHYSPSNNTTSEILTTIADHMARNLDVLVLSGTPTAGQAVPDSGVVVVGIKKSRTEKGALVGRAIAEIGFALRAFFRLLWLVRRGDIVLTVTAPFMLPYAVVAATALRRVPSILIMHDFYPHVLVLTGLLKPGSLASRVIHALNGLMFRLLSRVVIIGRETEPLLRRYRGLAMEKVCLIPNWATLAPGVRTIDRANVFRSGCGDKFVVGLSGNLGFTHDPDVVFEAARLLQNEETIHILLSGWGIGFTRLQELQAAASLPNVTFVDRVPSEALEALLAAADAWIIPYRASVAGVSVPSRLYNLLAVGRPVFLVSDASADAAHLLHHSDIGWVVPPGDASGLAAAIKQASRSSAAVAGQRRERAASTARDYSVDRALHSYETLIREHP